MELQSQVRVYNDVMGIKGARGRLVQIHEAGYYEVALEVKQQSYEALFPIAGTVLVATEALPEIEPIEVERFLTLSVPSAEPVNSVSQGVCES